MIDALMHINAQTLIHIAGYSGLFFVVFAETGLFFGFFLPGDSLLFTAGFLASQGLLHIWILIPLIITAATLGNIIGYGFGRYMSRLFTESDSKIFKKEYLARAEAFFEQHGKRAMLLGRFLPIIRTFLPIAAGAAKMPYTDFMTYNVLGAIVWGGGLTYLGYALGKQIPDAEHFLFPIILLIVVISFVPPYLHYRSEQKKKK